MCIIVNEYIIIKVKYKSGLIKTDCSWRGLRCELCPKHWPLFLMVWGGWAGGVFWFDKWLGELRGPLHPFRNIMYIFVVLCLFWTRGGLEVEQIHYDYKREAANNKRTLHSRSKIWKSEAACESSRVAGFMIVAFIFWIHPSEQPHAFDISRTIPGNDFWAASHQAEICVWFLTFIITTLVAIHKSSTIASKTKYRCVALFWIVRA